MFGVKDSVPNALGSRLVYKFTRAGCHASMSGKPFDILPHGFTNIYTLTVILTSSGI